MHVVYLRLATALQVQDEGTMCVNLLLPCIHSVSAGTVTKCYECYELRSHQFAALLLDSTHSLNRSMSTTEHR